MDKTVVTMNDLPNEILQSIFKNLKVRDLIQCRLVCEQFMFVCDDIKIPELVVSNQIENIKDSWFFIDKLFNHEDAIDITTYRTYRTTFRLEKFVRRLYFKGSLSDYVQLNLNNLTELEQLKIDLDKCSKINHSIAIHLLNLKILEIGNESRHFIFNLTAPTLRKLKCEKYSSIRINDPSSINHLEVSTYIGSGRINTLTNLQYLKVQVGTIPSSNILSVYPRLTTFKFGYNFSYENGPSIHALRCILEQKLILKRPELKIYFHSVELVDIDTINKFEVNLSTLENQINNYNLMCDDAYSVHFDYVELMSLFQGQIPDDFFMKYSSIKTIFVSGKVESQEDLMSFLKRFAYLKALSLIVTSLDQSFFDGLYDISNLTHLNLAQQNCSHLITNYDFLFKLKILKTFRTNRDSAEFFDLGLVLYERLKYFVSIHFLFCLQQIDIVKEKQFVNYRIAHYSFLRKCILVKAGLDFDELALMVNESK